MATECYALLRAHTLRVTALTTRGSITSPVRYGVSRSASRIGVDEVVEEQGHEVQRDEEGKTRLVLYGKDEMLAYALDVAFVRTDPSLIGLMTDQPVVVRADGTIAGLDVRSRLPVAAFALEVWSKLRGPDKRWGYTVFPYLKGGTLSGFQFSGGTVTFTISRSRTIRGPRWSVGPYDMTGWHERLTTPVFPETAWRNFVTGYAPPNETDGIESFVDRISNGNAADPHPLRAGILSGGDATGAGPWIVNGGVA